MFAQTQSPKPSALMRAPSRPRLSFLKGTIRSIENPRGSNFVGGRAQGDAVARIFDAPRKFEFEQRHPHHARRGLRGPSQFVESDRRRAEQGDDPLARRLGFVAGPIGRSAEVIEFVTGSRSRRRLWVDSVQSLFPPKRLARLAAPLAHDIKIVRAYWLERRQHVVHGSADRGALLQKIVGSLGARIEGGPGHGKALTVLLEREPRGDERARAPSRLDHHDT